MSTAALILIAIVSITLLLALVMWLQWPAYLALLTVSVLTGLMAGIQIDKVIATIIEGMGGTLGSVALLVGLGAMLGGIIERSGGAEVIATKAGQILGQQRLGPALLIASGLVAIPIFFDVAYIILVPIIFSFAKAAGHRNPAILGAPVAATMVFIHNTVPPHPGVTGSTTLLREELLGMVTILGILLSIPIGLVIYFVAKRITAREFVLAPEIQEKYDTAGAADLSGESGDGQQHAIIRRPSAGLLVFLILLPIVMIAVGTLGNVFLDPAGFPYRFTQFIGAPGFALVVATILSMLVLGLGHGWPKQELSDLMDASLGPAAVVVFVTGAGGVFAKVLTVSGIGDAISGMLVNAGVPILLLAFLLALAFKVAQGSGTVATLTAAGLIQSTVGAGDYSDLQVTLIILAIGMGSVSLSHINDSGFWIASRFLGLDVAGGLRTWTVLCTVAGFLGMTIISVLWLIA